MTRNGSEVFAQRLYARVPAHYRAYDAERGLPLLALLRAVGEQAANLRQDLDALWDNFFIETCDDWAVPYIGALLGTRLLAQPVGQSSRLEVSNTVRWRRAKGTVGTLESLSEAITEWPSNVTEFFQQLGWSQHVNRVRPQASLMPDLRDAYGLSLLGRGAGPAARATDFRGSTARTWATSGRPQLKSIGVFVRRLRTFPIQGATPAAAPPGAPPPENARVFSFDPLFRELPLFDDASRRPITREALAHAPFESFGSQLGVRQFGVLLASDRTAEPALSRSRKPFDFGGTDSGLALEPNTGIRLMEPRRFQSGAAHFLIEAGWRQGAAASRLGSLSTLGSDKAFQAAPPVSGAGQLTVTVRTAAPAAQFPGGVIAVRAARQGPARMADALYVYLPLSFVTSSNPLTYFVADDGATYHSPDLQSQALARASEGQTYPARAAQPSAAPAGAFNTLHRGAGGIRPADSSRFAGAAVSIRIDLFTGAFQPLGAIASVDQSARAYPDLNAPEPWPAFTYAPSRAALGNQLPEEGLLSILLTPLAGDFIPAAELIVANRRGRSLLVYLPEVSGAPSQGLRLFVADDGSTYFAPASQPEQFQVLHSRSLGALRLARAAAGQVLPIPGVWPLEQRRPVAIDLCRAERSSLLQPGEFGIDPERGRFAFAPGDAAIGKGGLTVDYVEAFSDQVGALNYDRQLAASESPKRLVSSSGDADTALAASGATLHSGIDTALAAAEDGDVIEIVDSATYAMPAPIVLARAGLKHLTIRAAAGQRPCVTFFAAPNTPPAAGIRVAVPMSRLELNGLLMSGGPLLVESPVERLHLISCTLDPRAGGGPTLAGRTVEPGARATWLLHRCVTGAIALDRDTLVTIADSIVDRQGGVAIDAGAVQLERVTVLGRIACRSLWASEALLDDLAVASDRQAGGLRYSRYEKGSELPARYQCVPSQQRLALDTTGRSLPPRFQSRRFGRPGYCQLSAGCPAEILEASAFRSEVGAFAGTLNTVRLANLRTKLAEFLPAGLSAVVVAET